MSDEQKHSIILEGCDPNNIEAITTAMAVVFPIRKEMALQLTISTPIVILDDLNKAEANAVMAVLNEAIAAGAEIKVLKSDSVTARMTKVKWPEKPKINKMDIADLVKMVGEQLISKHACPYCGGELLVNIDEYGENISVEAACLGAPPPIPGRAPAQPPPPQPPLSDDFILSNDDLIAEIEEPHIPRTEEITNMLDNLLGNGVGGIDSWGGTAALEAAPQPPLPAPPAPMGAPLAPLRQDTVGNDQVFNVFLPKLTTDDKKEKAVPLIVMYAGISTDEARKLTSRIVIPLVRGVGKEKAEEIKDKFMAIGILPRIRQQV